VPDTSIMFGPPPLVLELLLLQREPTGLTLKDLCGVAELAWADQPARALN
jgi:hypothetical protein